MSLDLQQQLDELKKEFDMFKQHVGILASAVGYHQQWRDLRGITVPVAAVVPQQPTRELSQDEQTLIDMHRATTAINNMRGNK